MRRIFKEPEVFDFDAELFGGRRVLHSFISYLLWRILLRQCVSVGDDCCAIGARAAVDSTLGIQISTGLGLCPGDA